MVRMCWVIFYFENHPMSRHFAFVYFLCVFLSCSHSSKKINLTVSGLQEVVEVIRDTAGINHIYAKNEHDLNRDIGARLFRFRGDLKNEFNYYHPRGEEIINAFTEGVNAYIIETEKDATLLPTEFKLLGMKPGRWTPDLVISRHQGLLGNITEEVRLGRAVAKI